MLKQFKDMTEEDLKKLKHDINLELRSRKIEKVEKIVKEMNELLIELNSLGIDLMNDEDGCYSVYSFSYDIDSNEDAVLERVEIVDD